MKIRNAIPAATARQVKGLHRHPALVIHAAAQRAREEQQQLPEPTPTRKHTHHLIHIYGYVTCEQAMEAFGFNCDG
jgi:hypothetical protein